MVVGGRYRLSRELGAGGFGRVWQAHDLSLGVDVAIKEVILPPAGTADERERHLERAWREARHAARLRDHPNIVTTLDVVEHDGLPWLVMQLVDGHSIQQDLNAGGRLPVPEATTIAIALLSALGAAHEVGLLHRDVKPANVLRANDGTVLLSDFGIAIGDGDPTLTASGDVVGTLAYTAPERLNGAKATSASDLYSLGATLYHIVEGVLPFDGYDAMLRAQKPVATPEAPHADRLAALITALLARNPGNRPTIAEAKHLLTHGSSSTPPEDPTPPGEETPVTDTPPKTAALPVTPPPKDRSGLWLLVVAVVALLVLGYHVHGGFSQWVNTAFDLNGSMGQAERGDCVHATDPFTNSDIHDFYDQNATVTPCFSAAANYTFLAQKNVVRWDYNTAKACGTAHSWRASDWIIWVDGSNIVFCLKRR